MPRYRLTVEYDGAAFFGWQAQAECDGPTVQGTLEAAAARLNGGTRAVIHAAGRTDAGVHALGQVIHLDFEKDYEPGTVRDALNFHVKPLPVSIVAAERAAPGFHARFDAIGRHYRYRILARRPPPALDAGRVWHVNRPLDLEAMQAAARLLVGTHDFTSFRATECQAKSPIKTLDRLEVFQAGTEIHVEMGARSFLHNQVRITVGTLRLVGEGKWGLDEVQAALDARRRAAAGPTAPAGGLTLMSVDYPPA